MEPTYQNLKPIIVNEEVDGSQVKVKFQAPGQPQAIEAIAVVAASQSDAVKSAGKGAVKRGIFSSLISGVSRAVGGAVGGTAGSVASSATSSMGHEATRNQTSHQVSVNVTQEKKEAAVVQAFDSVKSMFEWDGDSASWKGVTPPTS